MITSMKNFTAMGLTAVLIFALFGCDYIPKEHKGAVVGAGAGAATGAVAGQAFGHHPVAGALLGALVGGAIGDYVYDQRRDREQTLANYNYEPSSGTRISIEDVSVNPRQVDPGGTVDLKVTYALLTPVSDQSVAIKEIREVEHNNRVVANPEVTVRRTGGTYTSNIPVKLPSTAEAGQYTVKYDIEGGTANAVRTEAFTVR